MLKRGLHIAVACMIYLLLIMPLYSSVVFAEITSFSMDSGKGTPVNIRKTDGLSVFHVTARASGYTRLTPTQIVVAENSLNDFTCDYNESKQEFECENAIREELAPGPRTYTAILYSSGAEFIDQKAISVLVDDTKPLVNKFDAQVKGANVNVSFSALDPDPESPSGVNCAGLKQIDILKDGVKFASHEINHSSCLQYSNSTMIEIPITGTESKIICARAVDKLDQWSEVKEANCKNVTIDLSLPSIHDLKIVYSGTNATLNFIMAQPVLVDVIATIKEDEALNNGTAIADFSEINERPDFSPLYETITSQSGLYKGCALLPGEDDLYECRWEKIMAYATETKDVSLNIKIQDKNDNEMDSTYSVHFEFDNTNPAVLSLKSSFVDRRGMSWVSPAQRFDIIADIIEDGSGFNHKNLLLDFAAFGPQNVTAGSESNTVLVPNECEEGWTCLWKNLKVKDDYESGQSLNLNFIYPSSDDAGNALEGRTTTAVYYDETAPTITGNSTSLICPVAGDTLDITINVTDAHSGDVKAIFSAPRHSFDQFPQEVECEETRNNRYVCEISIDNLVSLYVNDDFNITLVDAAGNQLETSYLEITGELPEVCESAETEPPNLITIRDVIFQPYQGLDLKIASQIPHPFYVFPTISPLDDRVEIQKISFEGCEAENTAFTENMLVNEFNFQQPILSTKVSLGNLTTQEDNMDITCAMSFIMRSGQKVYQLPEVEEFKFNVPLHGTPFGEIDQSIAVKIDDIKDQIDDLEDTIDDMELANNILGTICTIAEIMGAISVLIGGLKLVLAIVGVALQKAISAGKWYETVCYALDYVQYFSLSIAWNPSWLSSFNIGSAVRILCSLYTCKLVDSNNFLEAILPAQEGTSFEDWSTHKRGSRYTFNFNDEFEQNKPQDYDWAFIILTGGLLAYDWDPYKSEDASWAFLCVPGLLYNFKKKRQLLCMKARCIEDTAKGISGLTMEDCETMHATRECVYVTSAAAKMVDGHWLSIYAQSLFSAAVKEASNQGVAAGAHTACELANTPSWKLAQATYSILGSNTEKQIFNLAPGTQSYDKTRPKCGSQPSCSLEDECAKDLWLGVACSLMISILYVMDKGSWFDTKDWDWNKYNRDVNDPDFCGPY